MARGEKKRSDHRAETCGKGMSGFPHIVADTPAYLSLSPFERAVHGEILRRFNGYNNGSIAITYGEIGERLKGRNTARPNNGRIARAIATLVEHGLITEPTPASWLQRRAREYRLTYISSGKGPPFSPATNEWRSWKPPTPQIEGDAMSPRNPHVGDRRSPGGGKLGYDRSPAISKKRSFASNTRTSIGDATSLLIDKPYPVPGERGPTLASNLVEGPWTANICAECGMTFTPGSRGAPKRFCSEKCRKKVERRRWHERQRSRERS